MLEVPGRAAEVAALRWAVCRMAAQAGLAAERQADVALALSEACANVVTHAYAGWPQPGPMRVTAGLTPEGFLVTVADAGRGMGPREDSPGLGLGLPLIAALAASVELETLLEGGSRVQMLFAVNRFTG